MSLVLPCMPVAGIILHVAVDDALNFIHHQLHVHKVVRTISSEEKKKEEFWYVRMHVISGVGAMSATMYLVWMRHIDIKR